MRRVLAAATVALVVPAVASGHVTIAPPFVEDGVETAISFQTPNERPPNETISLSVKAPPGISIDSVASPPGWHANVSGSSVTWTGGRLVDRTTTSFPVHITARVRAGTYSFGATQVYSDNAKVSWNADLSVLPASGAAAPKQHPWGAISAAVAGIVVIGGSLVALHFFRGRSLSER
jgi:uncharacterized protein YcnI